MHQVAFSINEREREYSLIGGRGCWIQRIEALLGLR